MEILDADELTLPLLRRAKRHGFSDAQIGKLRDMGAEVVRGVRHALGVRPVYKTVDTCAAEFAAHTPYHYSSYDEETEVEPRDQAGRPHPGQRPNRIGQGIEFDYSCVHAALALSEVGYETVMVNCNPETVSTDYDTSDRLYFEPLTLEDVLEIVHAEQQAGPVAGVIVQLGGQTPLGLAAGLEAAGVPIVGTSPDAIHLAEERGAFGERARRRRPPVAQARHGHHLRRGQGIADEIGYPVLVRPSYVLGGRGMEIVYDEPTAQGLHRTRHRDLTGAPGAGRPVPGRRGRDRRRRAVRRHRAVPRRRDGAHRGGRACTPATRRARCHRSRWAASEIAAHPRVDARPSRKVSACSA